MQFKDALKNLQKAKSAKIQADKNLVLAETRLQKSRSNIETAHEELTDVLAQSQVGDVSEDSIEKARQGYDSAKLQFEEAKTALEVAKKVIPLTANKLQKAKEQFNKPAFNHYKKMTAPLIDEFLEALNNFERIEQKMQKLRDEIDGHGLSSGNFLPTGIKALKLNHLKFDYSFERLRKDLNDLKK